MFVCMNYSWVDIEFNPKNAIEGLCRDIVWIMNMSSELAL